MRTVLIYLLALSALGAAVAFALPQLLSDGGAEAARAEAPAVPPVVVAHVTRAPLTDNLEALGTVLANESVTLTPNRADHVAKIHFHDGQEVAAGDLLVEMHAEEEQGLLAEASAMRDERQVRYDQLQELFEREMTSQRDLDNAKALLAAAQARVVSLQAAIEDRSVRAPFAGTLGLRRVSEGSYLQPSAVITTLDDLSVVKLDFTIPETWLSAVESGQKITARSDAWPDSSFTGEVTTVDTRLDARTRSATVRAVLPNPERKLRPGMLLKVTVDRGEQDVLQIPEEALVPLGDEQFVFRVDDDQIARQVRVKIGRRQVGTVELLDGLAEADRVVVEGIVRVRPDSAVQVVATREHKS